ncbi:glycosyltransferase [Corynebacterium confusum]
MSTFNIQAISATLTAMAVLFVNDPRKFVANVSQKLGFSGVKWPLNPLKIEVLESKGEFDSCLRELSSGKDALFCCGGKRRVLKRLLREMRYLDYSVLDSPTRQIQPEAEIVLFVATNSVPYTQSGYSLRTDRLLRSLAEYTDIAVGVLTRFGYPAVIGSLASCESDTIERLTYHRALPWKFSLDPQESVHAMQKHIVKLANEVGATVIHTTTDFKNALAVSRAADELGIPWIYEVRGEPEATWLSTPALDGSERRENAVYYRMCRDKEIEVARAARRVIALSKVSKSALISRGVDSTKISVVPNGFDDKLPSSIPTKEQTRQELGLPQGKLLGVISALVPYEGIDFVISAMSELPKNTRLLIVGDGSERLALEELSRRLGLSDRVFFVGKKPSDEIWKWYSCLDIFLIPRVDSPVTRTVTPMKGMMAQALGVPVIASDLPALREITDGREYYFRAEDRESYLEQVRTVIQETQPLERAQGWDSSRTWGSSALKLKEVYRTL